MTIAALALVAAAILAVAAPARARDTIYGYVAVADVRVPGNKLQKITVTGGFASPLGPDAALGQARALATARLSQCGTIVNGPVVNLCSPFVGSQEKREDIP
jgi:hypothetical protein